jgi:hypothetical protein
MYILVFESGEIKKAHEISIDDITSVADGILEIIDITRPSSPKYAIGDGTWEELESADE